MKKILIKEEQLNVLRKFLIKESSNQELVQRAFEYITNKYTENDYIYALDEEINSGDWLDEDWADEFESHYEAYTEQGRGEAEDAVLRNYVKEACKYLNCKEEQLVFDVEPDIYQMLKDEWNITTI